MSYSRYRSKKGNWGFINFIREHDFPENTAVVKGTDCIGRPFFAVKAEFVFEDGSTLPSFSTFYQKYCNNKNIWQCFNYPNRELLKTFYEGDGCPMNTVQFELLNQLLTHGRIDLTDQYIAELLVPAALVPAALVPAALVPAALVPAALVPAALVPAAAKHLQLRTTTLLCNQ